MSVVTSKPRPLKSSHSLTIADDRRMLSGLSMTMRKASLVGSFAWKHNDAEDADAAECAFSGDMRTVSLGPRGLSHGQTACEKARERGYNYEVSCDGNILPPNTLLSKGVLASRSMQKLAFVKCSTVRCRNWITCNLKLFDKLHYAVSKAQTLFWHQRSAIIETRMKKAHQPKPPRQDDRQQKNKFSGISSPVTFGEEVTSLNRSVGKRLLWFQMTRNGPTSLPPTWNIPCIL